MANEPGEEGEEKKPGKAPAFQVYPRDRLADPAVRALPLEAKGAYWELAWHSWNPPADANGCPTPVGALPNEPELLADLSGLGEEGWQRHGRRLLRCFVLGADGFLTLPWIQEQVGVQAVRRAQKSAAGKASAAARAALAEQQRNGNSTGVELVLNGGVNEKPAAAQQQQHEKPTLRSASASASAGEANIHTTHAGEAGRPVPWFDAERIRTDWKAQVGTTFPIASSGEFQIASKVRGVLGEAATVAEIGDYCHRAFAAFAAYRDTCDLGMQPRPDASGFLSNFSRIEIHLAKGEQFTGQKRPPSAGGGKTW